MLRCMIFHLTITISILVIALQLCSINSILAAKPTFWCQNIEKPKAILAMALDLRLIITRNILK